MVVQLNFSDRLDLIFILVEKNQNKDSTLNLSFNTLSKWHEPDISVNRRPFFQNVLEFFYLSIINKVIPVFTALDYKSQAKKISKTEENDKLPSIKSIENEG